MYFNYVEWFGNLACGNSSGNNCLVINEKNRLYIKSKVMKIKASGIVILQRVHQNYIP